MSTLSEAVRNRKANPVFTSETEVWAGREHLRLSLRADIADPKVVEAEYALLLSEIARSKTRHCAACQGDAAQFSAIAETLRLVGSLAEPLAGGVKGYKGLFTNEKTQEDVRDVIGNLVHTQILQNMAHIRAILRALNRRLDSFVEE